MQIPYRAPGQPLALLMDGTGIEFPGDGAWLAREHGASRRGHRGKVHIAVDAATGDVRSVEFTSSRRGDSPLQPELSAQIPAGEPIETCGRP